MRLTFFADENKQQWADRANKLVDEWEKYKTQMLAAFCRRSGNWRPSKHDKKISWNALIQSITVNDVAEGFDAFDDDLIALVNHATNDISELFRGLETKLEGKTVHFLIRDLTDICTQNVKIFREYREPRTSSRAFNTSETPF